MEVSKDFFTITVQNCTDKWFFYCSDWFSPILYCVGIFVVWTLHHYLLNIAQADSLFDINSNVKKNYKLLF